MEKLDRYLRGQSPAPFTLLARAGEGGPWRAVKTTDTLSGMREEMRAGTRGWDPPVEAGDLVRLVGPGLAAQCSAVLPDGTLVALPRPEWQWVRDGESTVWAQGAGDWPTAWETCPRPEWMLHAVVHTFGRRRWTPVACAMARLLLADAPTDPPLARRALEAAEAWAARTGSWTDRQEAAGALGEAVTAVSLAADSPPPARLAFVAMQAAMGAVPATSDPAQEAWYGAFCASCVVRGFVWRRELARSPRPGNEPLRRRRAESAARVQVANALRAILPTPMLVRWLVEREIDLPPFSF